MNIAKNKKINHNVNIAKNKKINHNVNIAKNKKINHNVNIAKNNTKINHNVNIAKNMKINHKCLRAWIHNVFFLDIACIRPITIHSLTDSTSLHGSIPVISTIPKGSGYTMVHTVRHHPRAPKWWSDTDLLDTAMLQNKLRIRNP